MFIGDALKKTYILDCCSYAILMKSQGGVTTKKMILQHDEFLVR
jgi:hypothetical protein